MATTVHDSAANRQRLPHGRARAHSRLVRMLRVILPIIMLAVLGVLVALVSAHAIRREAAAHKNAGTPIRMVNPHFFGRDNRGRAYALGARQAVRDEQAFQRVLLTYPSITLDLDSAHPSKLTADLGVYHEDTRILYLKGHVKGVDQNRAEFATQEAVVNTRTGVVNSQTALAGQTNAAGVNARSFDVYDKGDRVILKGGVHARLNQH
jgi:lipopolysaccharide export system protein LptC